MSRTYRNRRNYVKVQRDHNFSQYEKEKIKDYERMLDIEKEEEAVSDRKMHEAADRSFLLHSNAYYSI